MIIESSRSNTLGHSGRFPVPVPDATPCNEKIGSMATVDVPASLKKTVAEAHPLSPKKRYVKSTAFRMEPQDMAIAELHFEHLTAKQHSNRIFKENLASVTTVRGDLISFCWSVCKQLTFSLSTYYLSLAYLDAVFAHYAIKEAQARICAYSAVMLAAKLEESVDKIPTMADTLSFFQNVYDDATFRHYENVIFQCMGFQLNLKTPYTLLNAYLAMGMVEEDELLGQIAPTQLDDFCTAFESLAAFFLEVSALEYEFNRFTSQTVAAATIVCARWCLGLEEIGTATMATLRLTWEDLTECLLRMVEATKRSNSQMTIKIMSKLMELEDEIVARRRQAEETNLFSFEELSLGDQETAPAFVRVSSCASPQNHRSTGRNVQSNDRQSGRASPNTYSSTVKKDRATKKSTFADSFGTKRAGRSSAYRLSH
jgi:hypothetical protein